MKKIFFLVFIFHGLNLFSYDIDAYIKKAIERSNDIKKAQETLDISRKNYFSSSISFYAPEIYYSLWDVPYSNSKTFFSVREKDFNSALSVNYRFFNNFSDKITKDLSFISYMADQYRLDLKKQEIAFGAINAYCSNLTSIRLAAVFKEDEKSYEEQFIKAKEYYKSGLRSYSDLLKSELNFKKAQLSSLYYENELKKSKMSANALVYEDPLLDIDFTDLPADLNFKIEQRETLINKALENRLEIKIQEAEIKTKKKNLAKKKFSLPADFYGDFSYSKDNIFSLGSKTPASYQVKIGLSLPLSGDFYDKFKNISEYSNYLSAALRDMEELKLEIKKQVAEAVLNFDYDLKKYEVSKVNSEISRNNLDIIKAKYSQGKASVIDLIEAQKDDLSAQSDLAGSYYQLYKSYYSLKKSIGENLWL